MVDDDGLGNGEDNGNLGGTVSATEVIGTCWGAGGNCVKPFVISLSANFEYSCH